MAGKIDPNKAYFVDGAEIELGQEAITDISISPDDLPVSHLWGIKFSIHQGHMWIFKDGEGWVKVSEDVELK